MSIIFVKKELDKVIVGADSQETSGETCQENFEDSKLRQIDDNIYVGMVGDGHIGSLLYAYLEGISLSKIENSNQLIHFFKDFFEWTEGFLKDDTDKSMSVNMSQFIMIINQNVWYFNNFYVRNLKVGEYMALGSARQAALATASLGHTVEEVLKACCKVDIYCSLPIRLFEIKNK